MFPATYCQGGSPRIPLEKPLSLLNRSIDKHGYDQKQVYAGKEKKALKMFSITCFFVFLCTVQICEHRGGGAPGAKVLMRCEWDASPPTCGPLPKRVTTKQIRSLAFCQPRPFN